MSVNELIEWLKLTVPNNDDYGIYFSTIKDLGDEKKSKEIVNVFLDKENECVIFIVK